MHVQVSVCCGYRNRSVADDQQVVAYNENEPSLTLSTGEVHKADIIIAADGKNAVYNTSLCPALKPKFRNQIFSTRNRPRVRRQAQVLRLRLFPRLLQRSLSKRRPTLPRIRRKGMRQHLDRQRCPPSPKHSPRRRRV